MADSIQVYFAPEQLWLHRNNTACYCSCRRDKCNAIALRTCLGMRILAPRLATPDENSSMLEVSCNPVKRLLLAAPPSGSYMAMCRLCCLAMRSMAVLMCLQTNVYSVINVLTDQVRNIRYTYKKTFNKWVQRYNIS